MPTRAREPLKMTKLPESPWLTCSADFFGPLQTGHTRLVVMDDYSSYPEVEIIRSTNANVTIPHFDSIFSRHELPAMLKTDNGPPFNSEQFAQYTTNMGIRHRKITPYWPEANGE